MKKLWLFVVKSSRWNYESTEIRSHGNKNEGMPNGDLRETRKQFFSEMEQKLQKTYPKEEDRMFFEIPSPLCLKGLHLTL